MSSLNHYSTNPTTVIQVLDASAGPGASFGREKPAIGRDTPQVENNIDIQIGNPKQQVYEDGQNMQ